MTKPVSTHQFNLLCAEYTVAPCIALENEDLVQALLDGNIDLVEQILLNDF